MNQLDNLNFFPNREAFDLILSSGDGTSLWGVAPIAPLHLGYDSLIVAQKQLISTGLKHTVLMADYHAVLSHGYTLAEISLRSTYYENYLRYSCGLSAAFVRGSHFQTRPHYVELLYSAMSALPVSKVKDSLAKVAKGSGADATKVSAYMYSLMQCLDCCYLGAKVLFAEQGQAKIYELLNAFPGEVLPAREQVSHSHKADGKPSAFVYSSTSYDIKGQPLRQSRSQTRISIHDDEQTLKKKIDEMMAAPPRQALPPNCVNALLEFYKHSVFPWRTFPLSVKDIYAKNREYLNYDDFFKDYDSGELHPKDCKDSLFEALRERLAKIQKEMGSCICDWIRPST